MKTTITKKLPIIFLIAIFSVFLFSACSSKQNINISKNDLSSILIVNLESLTTKNIIDDNNGDFTATIDFLNNLKTSKNKCNNQIGEININTEENSISLAVYDNGVMIEDVLYSTETFNYNDFFNSLQAKAVAMQR